MTPNCNGCGAVTDSSKLVCGFCGAATQELLSVADELRALNELNRIAQSMVKSSANEGVLGLMTQNLRNQLGQGEEARIARFWKNAFLPRTLEAQSQAIVQMLTLITIPEGLSETFQTTFQNSARKAASIYFDRAEGILTSMRIQYAGDASAAAKIEVLEKEVSRERDRLRSARKKGWFLYAVLFIGSLFFLGIAGIASLFFGH